MFQTCISFLSPRPRPSHNSKIRKNKKQTPNGAKNWFYTLNKMSQIAVLVHQNLPSFMLSDENLEEEVRHICSVLSDIPTDEVYNKSKMICLHACTWSLLATCRSPSIIATKEEIHNALAMSLVQMHQEGGIVKQWLNTLGSALAILETMSLSGMSTAALLDLGSPRWFNGWERIPILELFLERLRLSLIYKEILSNPGFVIGGITITKKRRKC